MRVRSIAGNMMTFGTRITTRRPPSCYAAWQRPTSNSGRRRRPHHLSRIAATLFRTAQTFSAGLLSHVEPRAFDRRSSHRRGAGAESQTRPWTLRLLLERASVILGPRLAGTILFLPARRFPLMGSAPLHGVESGTRRPGVRLTCDSPPPDSRRGDILQCSACLELTWHPGKSSADPA